MRDNNIGCVIVIDESSNNPVGIITERDIVKNLTSPEANLRIQVDEIMSKPVICSRDTFFNRCIANYAEK
jgi:CBS domain-containing protein